MTLPTRQCDMISSSSLTLSSPICLMRPHETFQVGVSLVFLRVGHMSFACRLTGYCAQQDHTLTFLCILIILRTGPTPCHSQGHYNFPLPNLRTNQHMLLMTSERELQWHNAIITEIHIEIWKCGPMSPVMKLKDT